MPLIVSADHSAPLHRRVLSEFGTSPSKAQRFKCVVSSKKDLMDHLNHSSLDRVISASQDR